MVKCYTAAGLVDTTIDSDPIGSTGSATALLEPASATTLTEEESPAWARPWAAPGEGPVASDEDDDDDLYFDDDDDDDDDDYEDPDFLDDDDDDVEDDLEDDDDL